MSTVESPTSIDLPYAPAIDGLVIRHAHDDDWAAMAETLNATRAGDGVDEVRTTESLRAEYAHLDEFRTDRDVLVAARPRAHGRATRWACSSSARACSSVRCGARSGPRTGTRASARRSGARTATGSPWRRRRIPGPDRASCARTRSTSRPRTWR